MTLALPTPKAGFGESKISSLRWLTTRKLLILLFEYGDTVAGVWVPGDVQHVEKTLKNLGQVLDGRGGEVSSDNPVLDLLIASSLPLVTFTDMSSSPNFAKVIAAHPTHGDLAIWLELAYSATGRNLYQYAIDNWPEFAGSTIQ